MNQIRTHSIDYHISEADLHNQNPVKVHHPLSSLNPWDKCGRYKGKGIAYEGEVIRRKAGKTGK